MFMKNNKILWLFLSVLVLSGCTPREISKESSEDSLSSTLPPISEDITTSISEEDSESSSESSLPEIADEEIPGLSRSEAWPTSELNDYLTYAANIEMPVLNTDTSFHHGVVELEFGFFYQIITRVHQQSAINDYLTEITTNYDFNHVAEEMTDFHYLQSTYDDVRLHLSYRYKDNNHEVIFEWFDGDGDKYSGPRAIDNVATFDLRTKDALTSISPTRGRWEVRPATFSVYQRTSGYAVGNTNNEFISNPLRFYPGQEAIFRVDAKLTIEKIVILSASGYAEGTVNDATLSNGEMSAEGDWVTIIPSPNQNEISYKLAQVQYVSQVRWLRIEMHLKPVV